jgi:hypothetical protein
MVVSSGNETGRRGIGIAPAPLDDDDEEDDEF